MNNIQKYNVWLGPESFLLFGIFIILAIVPELDISLDEPIIRVISILAVLNASFLGFLITKKEVIRRIHSSMDEVSKLYEGEIGEKLKRLNTTNQKAQTHREIATIYDVWENFEGLRNFDKYLIKSFILLGITLIVYVFLPFNSKLYFTKNQILSTVFILNLYFITRVLLVFMVLIQNPKIK